MKLMRLQKMNSIKEICSLILSSLFLFTKKENLSNILLYSIMSLLGYFLIKKDKNVVKTKDWKEFINNEINNKENNTEDNLSDIENDLNNNINELKMMKKILKKKYYMMTMMNMKMKMNNYWMKIDLQEIKTNKVIDKNNNEKVYPDNVNELLTQYKRDFLFRMKVNENNKNMPIFNLRSSDKIDFFWNFHLHNTDNTKINNLILCRDINQWMNNSSISNEDLENQCYPFYIIIRDRKSNNEIMIFEAYKIFVYSDEELNKQAFIVKGDNYKTVEEILNILINLGYIKDLLNGKEYESYNLSGHNSVNLFLNNLLSHFLPYESQEGEIINIDLKQFNENKTTFDYFYHTNMIDNDMFNTNI